ncbi:MAG: ester cyclase [Actinomycetota bacterium]|nr:ester cyclase [Actinomycetota bacterium]
MSSREQFVRRMFQEAWSQGHTAMIAEEIGDVIFHYGGDHRRTTGQELRSVVERWRQGFPDLRFHVEDLVEDDDRIAVRARLRGTHLGRWRDLPATTREIDIEVMMFFRWENGRLVEIWEVDDAQTRDRQLGIV